MGDDLYHDSAEGVLQGSAKGPVEGRYAKRPCKAPS